MCRAVSWNNPDIKEFYKRIKKECPATIFHGTDVGHQYDSTGQFFLMQLREKQQENSEIYRIVQENIEQGKYVHEHMDFVYRENRPNNRIFRQTLG